MKKYYFFFLLLFWAGNLSSTAQTVINKYAAVLAFQPCANVLTVDTATDFNVGDTVLMIQMKGVLTDSSNTAAFGNILSYRGAGNYEFNIIKAKSGNQLTLLYSTLREYDVPEGKVQLVRVPYFQNYTINQPHTCMPWDGSKGGVFAIDVQQTLLFNSNIDVSGKGFRGGTNTPVLSPSIVCDITSFTMAPNIDSSGRKGEGIADIAASGSYGRGKLANGGGGGNAHNGGGGGGSNGDAGGQGGSQYRGCNSNPAPNITGGQSGTALSYSNNSNKIFMGGGGGSSQSNNNTTTTGGNGGGICIITAGTLDGNSHDIKANGAQAAGCINDGTVGKCHDGMGGGGAAGTVLLNTNNFNNTTHIELNGGRGGDVASSAIYDEVGPGGGGSGGILWIKPAAMAPGIALSNLGGSNGLVQYNGSAWGAEAGQDGHTLTQLALNFPTDTFKPASLIADFSDSTVDCFTRHFIDQSLAPDVVYYHWFFPEQHTSTQQYPDFTFPGYGTHTVILVITVSSGCTDTVSKEIVIPYVRFADAGRDTSLCPGGRLTLQASGGSTYLWSPATGLSRPNAPITEATITQTTTYTVTVTNAQGCTDVDSVSVVVVPVQAVNAASDGTVIDCEHRSAKLSAAGATSYSWSPGRYCNDSTSASPRVSPPETTVFTVTAISEAGCISQDTVTVTVYSEQAQIFVPNAFSPNGDGLNDDIGPAIRCGFTLEQFSIFNRWGQRVFMAQGPGTKWNGSYNDLPAELGTYYYYIGGRQDNGDRISFKGDFTLIR